MTRNRLARSALAPLPLLLLGAGCIGNIGDSGDDVVGPGSGPESCQDGAEVTFHPLRRLTPTQYTNTVRDLFGDQDFEADLDVGSEIITEREVRQLRDNAELIVGRQSAWTQTVFPCDVTGAEDEACVSAFLDGFVRRAFRRPITEADRTWLLGVYAGTRADMTFQESMETLLQVVLQSPSFVYLYEGGVAGASEPTRALSDHELASRLSYFLWDTMPDGTLSAAADDGALADPVRLAQEATRLLDDPRAEHAVEQFTSSWLQLDGGVLHQALELAEKDPALYPEFDAELVAAMRTETQAFMRRLFFEENGTLEDLMNANYAYVNGPLATLYGVEGPADAATWQWVELDPTQRSGLLTRAAFLSVLSTKTVTAPIRRGVWVLEEMLCTELGEPPANANNVVVEGGVVEGELLSVREDVIARTNGAECSSCHTLINPIGFAFENYDAIGRWQTNEVGSGLPVDASGYLATSGNQDGEVQGALELTDKLGVSDHARTCFAKRWMEQAIGDVELDQCTTDTIQAAMSEGATMRELVVAIIQSDAFRHVSVTEEP